MKRKDHFLIHLLLMILAVFEIAPVILLFINSFREDADIKKAPIGFIKRFDFSNYFAVWKIGNYGIAFINTLTAVICTIIIVVIVAGFAAYVLTKLNIPGQKFFIAYFVITMGIPAQVFIVPLYFMFSSVGLVNKLLSVIIIYGAIYLPFSIFLLRSFMVGIPKEIEEAAKVDGCTSIQVFLNIIVPLTKPAFTTVSIVVSVWVWNEFLFANTFLQMPNVKTAATKYYSFIGEHSVNLAYVFTAGALTILPVVILYLVFNRKFVEGMIQSGIKG